MKEKNIMLHIDHIIPVSKGGLNSEKNLITSCALCNMGKLDFDLEEKNKKMADDYLNHDETKERLKNGKAE